MLEIREATENDADILFKWANDPDTRANSFSKDEIKFDEHIKWLNKKLASEDSIIFIGVEDDVPVGVIRFDRKNGEAILSINIDNKFRGKGLGNLLTSKAIGELKKRKYCERVIAYVKEENITSVKLFQKAGFGKVQNTEIEKFKDALKFIFLISGNE